MCFKPAARLGVAICMTGQMPGGMPPCVCVCVWNGYLFVRLCVLNVLHFDQTNFPIMKYTLTFDFDVNPAL